VCGFVFISCLLFVLLSAPLSEAESGKRNSAAIVEGFLRDVWQRQNPEAVFHEAWHALQASGGDIDQEVTRNALAELVVSFAAEGETDPKQLKRLAFAALPRMLGTQ
jgi:hypothetical protein